MDPLGYLNPTPHVHFNDKVCRTCDKMGDNKATINNEGCENAKLLTENGSPADSTSPEKQYSFHSSPERTPREIVITDDAREPETYPLTWGSPA